MQIEIKEVIILFADDIIMYTENSKESTDIKA